MSEGSLRLKIKFGLNEVEIEGSIQDITKAVEIIQDIIKVIPNIILEKNHSLLHFWSSYQFFRFDGVCSRNVII